MTTLSIELEQDLAKDLRTAAEKLGISLSEVINRFLQQGLQNELDLQEKLTPTPYLIEVMRRAEEEEANGELVFMEWDEALAHLDKMIEDSV
ncbi:MAG: hypothetical protein FWG68_01265 [Defluviitaleaceae bacterium]|nr:hypothetical protein [Defluviitaleaceae bacterium]